MKKYVKYLIFCIFFIIFNYFGSFYQTTMQVIPWFNKNPNKWIDILSMIFFYPFIFLFFLIILLRFSRVSDSISDLGKRKIFFLFGIIFLVNIFDVSELPLLYLALATFIAAGLLLKRLQSAKLNFFAFFCLTCGFNYILLRNLAGTEVIVNHRLMPLIILVLLIIKNIGTITFVRYLELYKSNTLHQKVTFIVNAIIEYLIILFVFLPDARTLSTLCILAAIFCVIWCMYRTTRTYNKQPQK